MIYLTEVKMKVRTDVNRRCKDYQIVIRKGNLYVIRKKVHNRNKTLVAESLNGPLRSNKVITFDPS